MVKFILSFLCGKNISLMALMDNFTNKDRFECKAILDIPVTALVIVCGGWLINCVKTILYVTGTSTHLGFLWDTLEGTVALPEDKTDIRQPYSTDIYLQVNINTYISYYNDYYRLGSI